MQKIPKVFQLLFSFIIKQFYLMNFEERYFHRQTLVLDYQTQNKVRQLKVYLSGLTLLGLEVAKNLVMMGVKQLTLFDNNGVQKHDIQNSFYYKNGHLGQLRSFSASQKLKELSHFTSINCSQDNNLEQISSNFDVAVLVDCWDYQITKSLNYQMRKKGKGFIILSNLSLYGFIFVDFGDKHMIKDGLGQIAEKRYIKKISLNKQAVIQIGQGEKPFAIGDQIYIYNAKGMEEINGKVAKIINKYQYEYAINIDTTNFSPYRSGGIAHIHRKENKKLVFGSIDDNLRSTNCQLSQQYLAQPRRTLIYKQATIIRSFYQFYSRRKRLPALLDQQQAKYLKQIATQLLDQMRVDNSQRVPIYQILNELSLVGSLQISAFATLWGGIAVQQVIKYTGKYTPIHQWLHLDQTNIITKQLKDSENKYSLLFGDDLARNLSDSKIMMVGAGALGSEIIKMATEMNIGTKKGFITVVDDDKLNEYNLNRMCLVKKTDSGVNKADLLVYKGKLINNLMNLKSIKERLKPYNDKQIPKIPASICKQHQIIISAVDSFYSRKQINSYCVRHRKIMLNCGTQNLKCSTQVIIPYETQNYSALSDSQGEYTSLHLNRHHFPQKASSIAKTGIFILQQLYKMQNQFYKLTINKGYCGGGD